MSRISDNRPPPKALNTHESPTNLADAFALQSPTSIASRIINKISAAESVAAKDKRPKWRPGRCCETCKTEFAPLGLFGIGAAKDAELLSALDSAQEKNEVALTAAKKGRLIFEHKRNVPDNATTPATQKKTPADLPDAKPEVKRLADMFGGKADSNAIGPKRFGSKPGGETKISQGKIETKGKDALRKADTDEGDDEEKEDKKSKARKRKVKKHHCRNCGGVFCARCAKHMVAIPTLGYLESVRVCNACFPTASIALGQWLALNEQRNSKAVATGTGPHKVLTPEEVQEHRLIAEQELRRAARRQKKKEAQAQKELTNESININQEKSIFQTPQEPSRNSMQAAIPNARDQDLKLMSRHGVTQSFVLSAIDPLFTQIPKSEIGFRIWRIEFLEIEEWPKSRHGEFHKDDAYLILHSFVPENAVDERKNMEIITTIEHHIYFWVGSLCCHDEKAVAAIKSTELCRHLDGSAVIHRESEGHESPAFLALFPHGITYLDGGIETGLNEVTAEPEKPPRLFHIKGKQRVRISQVGCEWRSLNSGDVFILETKHKIWNWCGKDSNRFEQARSLQVSMSLREKKKNSVLIDALREGVDDGFKDNPEFWSVLGASVDVHAHIKPAEEAEPDETAEMQTILDLFEVFETGDEQSPFHFGLVDKKGSDLTRSLLNSEKMYILDCDTEIFIWIGKKTSRVTKNIGMRLAMQFLDYYDRPDWTPVTRMMESAEVPTFKAKFVDWDYEEIQKLMNDGALKKRRISDGGKNIFDLNAFAMHAHQTKENPKTNELIPKKPYEFTPGPKDGNMIIYEINRTDLDDVSAENYGFFSQQSSYVIVFTFQMVLPEKVEIPRDSTSAPNDLNQKRKVGTQHWVFFWQGKDSPKAAVITWKMELATDICGMLEESTKVKPVTFTIQQGREPDYFLGLFSQDIVVFRNKPPKVEDEKTEEPLSASSQLFHVKSTVPGNPAIALEVECVAKSLNPGDAYILSTTERMIVWVGEWSDEVERSAAMNIAKRLKGDRNIEILDYLGKEINLETENVFWVTLGGKLEQTCPEQFVKSVASDYYSTTPRLFQCTVADGHFRVTEIVNFHQEDLISDDVMMLDCKSEVYLWIGSFARKEEKEYALKLAQEYINIAPDGRNPDCPIIEVPEGNEPWIFTRHFHGWEHSKKGFIDPYQKNLDALDSLGVMGRVVPSRSLTSFDSRATTVTRSSRDYPEKEMRVSELIPEAKEQTTPRSTIDSDDSKPLNT